MNDVWIPLFLAKSELLTFFNVFPLKTSQAPARRLYQALTALIPDDFSNMRLTNDDGTPRMLDYTEASEVSNAATEFETVLKAELVGWDTFFVSQKGAYSTADLIQNAEIMLPDSTRMHLTEASRQDLRQAGRCLAFSLGTAAAFHIVRATETFIRRYYEFVVGSLPSPKVRNWGAYIKNLSQCPSADSKVLGWMTQIKDQYRNPVLHPDEVVNADDALEFVNACVSLMISIARALPTPST